MTGAQTIRLTVFNQGKGPKSLIGSSRKPRLLPLQLILLDLEGTVLARQNVNLAPRKGAFLEIDGNTLGLDDGERVEVMAILGWNHEVVTPRDAASGLPTATLQVYDTRSGQTTIAK